MRTINKYKRLPRKLKKEIKKKEYIFKKHTNPNTFKIIMTKDFCDTLNGIVGKL